MSEKGTQYLKEQDQPSPGGSKEPLTNRYGTCWEDIAELEIASIQPCPIIPDYKEPTSSILPIVVQTPTTRFCIDGWHFIEQAKAADRSAIRCHISHIAQHSDTEQAIRKVAIRVMPQGGKCSYAELVRNTHRLYQALRETSDDLVLFSHGGDRRGVSFTSSQENNIRVILAIRLGKSQTTINKYLQHGDGLNDDAIEALVDACAPKLFFEAIQTKKQTAIALLQSEQKDPSTIAETISKEVMQWLAESQEPEPPPATEQEREQAPQAERSASRERHTPNGNRGPAPTRRSPQNDSGGDQDPPASDPMPIDGTALTAELKRIGEALIGIADNQKSPAPQKIEIIRMVIVDLSTILQRLAQSATQEGNEVGGAD